jgi:hypothetical protein
MGGIMSKQKILYDLSLERIVKYNTKNNAFADFPVGTRVQIITPSQDFYFFYDETGVVTENKNSYLGIIVTFDKPRKFEDGYIQKSFNFNPEDLFKLEGKNDL